MLTLISIIIIGFIIWPVFTKPGTTITTPLRFTRKGFKRWLAMDEERAP